MSDKETAKEDKKKKKGPKKKGPIRFEAVIPIAVIAGLAIAYFILFFDTHMRMALEYAGTSANGAEVNVKSFKTSFIKGDLKIRGIQVTNIEAPTQNVLEVGQVHFQFLWDALLRGKFVINASTIDNIQIDTPRKKPGRILPPPPPEETGPSEVSKQAEKVKQAALDEIESENKQNVLGDIANIASGVDPNEQLKGIESELQAKQEIEKINKMLKEKENAWKKRLSELPNAKELKTLERDFKKIKLSGFKSPQELQKSIQELQRVMKEADRKIKVVQKTGGDLNRDASSVQKSIGSIDQLIKKDIQDIEKRLKIPKLDVKNLSASLFRKQLAPYMAKFDKYMKMAEEYMPPKKTEAEKAAQAEKAVTPKERRQGRNYHFGRPKSYPLFWLKKAKISSQAKNSPTGGNLEGEITDITSDPVSLGRPTLATLKGDFPGKQIYGFSSKLTIDHTTETPYESLSLNIDRFPIGGRSFSDSPEIRFAIKQASGRLKMTSLRKKELVEMKLRQEIRKVSYDVEAKNREVSNILKKVVAGIPTIRINASARGNFPHLAWNISSNLGREIQRGFQKQIQARIDQAKREIRQFVEKQIALEKKKLEDQYKKIKGQVDSKVKGAHAQVNKTKKKAEKKIAQAKKEGQKQVNRAKKKVEAELKKQLKSKKGKKMMEDLKKKFKF